MQFDPVRMQIDRLDEDRQNDPDADRLQGGPAGSDFGGLVKQLVLCGGINRLRKKSPFACFEGGLIAAVKADFAGERAVWDEFGGARAEGGIHLVIALAGEAYPVRAVAAVEITADRTEDELAASLRLEGDVGGLEHVDEIGVPQLHLGDPPPSEQWVLAGGHQVASSLGRRIRL